jgi:hypothetical protein
MTLKLCVNFLFTSLLCVSTVRDNYQRIYAVLRLARVLHRGLKVSLSGFHYWQLFLL